MIRKLDSEPKKISIEYEDGSIRSFEKGMIMGIEDGKKYSTQFCGCTKLDIFPIGLNFTRVLDNMLNISELDGVELD